MRFPYEYSYFVFDFCLIKKMCVRKQKREWAGGRRKQGDERERQTERGRRGREREEQEGRQSERGLGEISSLADEQEWVMRLTERCKHLHTLRQPWSMELMPMAWRIRRAGRRGDLGRSASLTVTSAQLKGHATNKALYHSQPCPMAQDAGDRLTLNKDDRLCMKTLQPELGAMKSNIKLAI